MSKEGDKKDERKSPAASSSILASVKASLGLLTPSQRFRYWIVVALQASLALLDLGGVLLLGITALLITNQATGGPLPTFFGQIGLNTLYESNSSNSITILFLVLSAGFLLSRSALSFLLTLKLTQYLATIQVQISNKLAQSVLQSSLQFVQKRPSHELNYAIIQGPQTVVTQYLAQLSQAIGEIAVSVLLLTTLFLVSPLASFLILITFAGAGVLLYWLTHNVIYRLGVIVGTSTHLNFQRLQEAIFAFREIFVLGRQSLYVSQVTRSIKTLTDAYAKTVVLGYVPVVTFQVALVLGLVGIMVVELSRSSIDVAIGAIAIFFGASLRIVPAVQRTVTLLSAMRQGMGQAEPTYRLARDLNSHKTEDKEIWFRGHQSTTTSPGPTDHSIVAQNVTFTYGQSPKPTLRNVSFKVPNNTSVALVGKTGAGKSTLVDILLGLLTPNMGQVELLGESPRSIIARNPGSVAYVPQQIAMFDLSIKENIALGLQTNSISDEEIWAALRLAQLDEFVMKAPQQLETLVGERGIRLSGGQRQRLGLARALLARPKVLFLDEATSSIDVETEEAVTGALTSLSGSITLFTIAHRLSTVRNAQHILFIDDGEILSAGSFEEVRSRVPQFAKHAELAGL